jgi:hypothetical protein
MADRGQIHSMERYKQAKLIDHSSWPFARNVTHSDIDAHLECQGCHLFIEFGVNKSSLDDLSYGQRRSLEKLLKSQLDILIVCRHCVPAGHVVNSFEDITEGSAYVRDGRNGKLRGYPLCKKQYQEVQLAFMNESPYVAVKYLESLSTLAMAGEEMTLIKGARLVRAGNSRDMMVDYENVRGSYLHDKWHVRCLAHFLGVSADNLRRDIDSLVGDFVPTWLFDDDKVDRYAAEHNYFAES